MSNWKAIDADIHAWLASKVGARSTGDLLNWRFDELVEYCRPRSGARGTDHITAVALQAFGSFGPNGPPPRILSLLNHPDEPAQCAPHDKVLALLLRVLSLAAALASALKEPLEVTGATRIEARDATLVLAYDLVDSPALGTFDPGVESFAAFLVRIAGGGFPATEASVAGSSLGIVLAAPPTSIRFEEDHAILVLSSMIATGVQEFVGEVGERGCKLQRRIPSFTPLDEASVRSLAQEIAAELALTRTPDGHCAFDDYDCQRASLQSFAGKLATGGSTLRASSFGSSRLGRLLRVDGLVIADISVRWKACLRCARPANGCPSCGKQIADAVRNSRQDARSCTRCGQPGTEKAAPDAWAAGHRGCPQCWQSVPPPPAPGDLCRLCKSLVEYCPTCTLDIYVGSRVADRLAEGSCLACGQLPAPGGDLRPGRRKCQRCGMAVPLRSDYEGSPCPLCSRPIPAGGSVPSGSLRCSTCGRSVSPHVRREREEYGQCERCGQSPPASPATVVPGTRACPCGALVALRSDHEGAPCPACRRPIPARRASAALERCPSCTTEISNGVRSARIHRVACPACGTNRGAAQPPAGTAGRRCPACGVAVPDGPDWPGGCRLCHSPSPSEHCPTCEKGNGNPTLIAKRAAAGACLTCGQSEVAAPAHGTDRCQTCGRPVPSRRDWEAQDCPLCGRFIQPTSSVEHGSCLRTPECAADDQRDLRGYVRDKWMVVPPSGGGAYLPDQFWRCRICKRVCDLGWETCGQAGCEGTRPTWKCDCGTRHPPTVDGCPACGTDRPRGLVLNLFQLQPGFQVDPLPDVLEHADPADGEIGDDQPGEGRPSS